MLVEIRDDFDLEKISLSGQCFRVRKFIDGTYRFISGDKVLYIQEKGNNKFSVSCDIEEWNSTWYTYFDLGRCYSDIFDTESDKHPFVRQTMILGRGIRVLQQNPWEMVITFIISQRKNIPAISKSIEMLAVKYGRCIETKYEKLYLFPDPQEMSSANKEQLAACGLGYRISYVFDAIQKSLSGELNLEALFSYSDPHLLDELQKVHGIGKKIANCIALFSYGRTGCVPIDVWISRSIEEECGGESPFYLFGQNAGIIQQYIFFYAKHRQSQGG